MNKHGFCRASSARDPSSHSRVRLCRLVALIPIALLALNAVPAFAQTQPPVIEGTEVISFDRPEAWAMKWFSSVTLFTSLGPPTIRESGSADLALELDWIPSLSEDQRRVGFNGTKVEDLSRLGVLPRPRLAIGIGRRFSLEAAWVPPVEVRGLTPNILNLAVERPLATAGNWTFGGRVYGQYAKIKGDITCTSAEAGIPPGSVGNEFGCERPSDDEVTMGYAGIAATVGYRLPNTRSSSFNFGVYGTYMDLEFQVNALTYGLRDRTRMETDGWTAAVTGGFSFPVSSRFRLAFEAFYSPLDVIRPPGSEAENDPLFNIRSLLSYSF